jgi:transcription antitermination factor NusG
MWYVLYTRPQAEKRVADTLEKLQIEVFCPMTTEIRQWSDRKKKITVPLFRSYVFIRLKEKDRHKVFEVPGVVRYLYWLGKPAIVRDVEIETIQNWISEDKIEGFVVNQLSQGDRVHLSSGAFKNEEAIIEKMGAKRVRLILVKLGCIVNARLKDLVPDRMAV